ncbi:DUF805 domain-containing protein [Kribbella sandramycini]|uniref:DUF805 domain-containing protein n=1 Tax=Kribbella sandramycini TaxID=60450 RepID=A0A7Y4NWQ9_9ACTN|nr:DUF805 domain-containing protein [Kribbella sandramycini]MBB6568331.1 uncharacterized membrane protein YhaH (DUF805 family) [Kribbella sandramycini]NOL39077.1 DUF805 domain-containing protein [Kribbella sandramycini]
MSWYLIALKKYAVFNGRSRRREYWTFTLFTFLLLIVMRMLDYALSTPGAGVFVPLYLLAIVLPALGVTVRRLHDTDRSGWWVLIQLVPLGGFVILYFAVQEGTPGANQFGPNPKAVS